MGPKFCNAACLGSGFKFVGSETSKKMASTAEECMALCIMNSFCTAFSYTASSSSCTLLVLVWSVQADDNVISGPRACDHCAEYGVQISDSSTSTDTASSGEECRGKCQTNASCNFYTFNHGTGDCWLSTSDSSKVSVANNLISSGDKHCGMDPALATDCYETDIRLTGSSDGTESYIKSLESCRRACYERDHCLYFSWERETAKCELFTVMQENLYQCDSGS